MASTPPHDSSERAALGKRISACAALAALLWLGARGLGPVPPLGPLLDPARGAWALARSADLPARSQGRIAGLQADVRVVYDDRAVPHLFAAREADAWRALGWVTARDRLFQLDLQARAGGGRLTGLLGARALPLDRAVRRLGMGRAAERVLAAMAAEERGSLQAYADGVNGYLASMPIGELPLEYRLLGTRPTPWSPLRSVEVMLRMQYTLTRNEVDLDRLRAAAVVGSAAADGLFPLHSPIQEPVQPSPGEPRQWHLVVPPPGAPDTAARQILVSLAAEGVGASRSVVLGLDKSGDDAIGSNNWAVAPSRTRNGAALLAGDPHLDLTLPSVWYEARIRVAGGVDAYGVTIPGLPAILIGFTRDLAWSFTNSEADLMDRWLESVDDSARPARYRLDGRWAALETRREVYLDPRGDTIAVDTVRFSHRGPLDRFGTRWISTRWTALESGGELAAIHRALRARTARAWMDAMAGWRSPPQNLLVADRAGDIAIRTTGRFPIRAGDGRGDLLHDGTTLASDWTADRSSADWPQSFAPAQGFLASANQEPQDPRDQPRYLGSAWVAPWRALRINQLLREDSAVTPESMRRWQTDAASARAAHYLPYFLAAAAGQPGDTALAHAAALLSAWNSRYDGDADAPTLFEAAMTNATRQLWDELPSSLDPGAGAFIALLDDPGNRWWDLHGTDRIERRDDILADALGAAYSATVRLYGAPEAGGWHWSRVHRIDIHHVLGLPSLSAGGLSVSGGPSTVSPSSASGGSTEGASWRMVVELDSTIRGWGTYPGGQSGNPASHRYDDRLACWVSGSLASLRFGATEAEVPATARLLLRPAR